MRQSIKPKRLTAGQTVGIVAPSSPPRDPGDIDRWISQIEALGFRTKRGAHVADRHGYLAGVDADRAADVNTMFADDDVNAIICLRSGYGSARLLPYLDYDLMRANPKLIVGFSDLTALVNVIQHKTGLVTFHGPEAEDELITRPYARTEFEKVVMTPHPQVTIGLPPHQDAPQDPPEPALVPLVSGRAHGCLMGGNLPTLVALMGTPYEPDFAGKILVLEGYGESTYQAGRYLNQLWLAGKLPMLAGVVFGQFVDYEEPGFPLLDVLTERFKELNIPALYGLMIGHMDQQTTVPIGCNAALDVDIGTLTLLEPAVL